MSNADTPAERVRRKIGRPNKVETFRPFVTEFANVLFPVVNERHQKKRAMLFTTNKSTNEWGNVLHDHDLAEVIVDRILERGRTLKLDGPSYRTRHLGLDGQPQPGVST